MIKTKTITLTLILYYYYYCILFLLKTNYKSVFVLNEKMFSDINYKGWELELNNKCSCYFHIFKNFNIEFQNLIIKELKESIINSSNKEKCSNLNINNLNTIKDIKIEILKIKYNVINYFNNRYSFYLKKVGSSTLMSLIVAKDVLSNAFNYSNNIPYLNDTNVFNINNDNEFYEYAYNYISNLTNNVNNTYKDNFELLYYSHLKDIDKYSDQYNLYILSNLDNPSLNSNKIINRYPIIIRLYDYLLKLKEIYNNIINIFINKIKYIINFIFLPYDKVCDNIEIINIYNINNYYDNLYSEKEFIFSKLLNKTNVIFSFLTNPSDKDNGYITELAIEALEIELHIKEEIVKLNLISSNFLSNLEYRYLITQTEDNLENINKDIFNFVDNKMNIKKDCKKANIYDYILCIKSSSSGINSKDINQDLKKVLILFESYYYNYKNMYKQYSDTLTEIIKADKELINKYYNNNNNNNNNYSDRINFNVKDYIEAINKDKTNYNQLLNLINSNFNNIKNISDSINNNPTFINNFTNDTYYNSFNISNNFEFIDNHNKEIYYLNYYNIKLEDINKLYLFNAFPYLYYYEILRLNKHFSLEQLLPIVDNLFKKYNKVDLFNTVKFISKLKTEVKNRINNGLNYNNTNSLNSLNNNSFDFENYNKTVINNNNSSLINKYNINNSSSINNNDLKNIILPPNVSENINNNNSNVNDTKNQTNNNSLIEQINQNFTNITLNSTEELECPELPMTSITKELSDYALKKTMEFYFFYMVANNEPLKKLKFNISNYYSFLKDYVVLYASSKTCVDKVLKEKTDADVMPLINSIKKRNLIDYFNINNVLNNLSSKIIQSLEYLSSSITKFYSDNSFTSNSNNYNSIIQDFDLNINNTSDSLKLPFYYKDYYKIFNTDDRDILTERCKVFNNDLTKRVINKLKDFYFSNKSDSSEVKSIISYIINTLTNNKSVLNSSLEKGAIRKLSINKAIKLYEEIRNSKENNNIFDFLIIKYSIIKWHYFNREFRYYFDSLDKSYYRNLMVYFIRFDNFAVKFYLNGFNYSLEVIEDTNVSNKYIDLYNYLMIERCNCMFNNNCVCNYKLNHNNNNINNRNGLYNYNEYFKYICYFQTDKFYINNVILNQLQGSLKYYNNYNNQDINSYINYYGSDKSINNILNNLFNNDLILYDDIYTQFNYTSTKLNITNNSSSAYYLNTTLLNNKYNNILNIFDEFNITNKIVSNDLDAEIEKDYLSEYTMNNINTTMSNNKDINIKALNSLILKSLKEITLDSNILEQKSIINIINFANNTTDIRFQLLKDKKLVKNSKVIYINQKLLMLFSIILIFIFYI